ncbi:MAG: serine hydrolase domain-containing protein [Pseudomonadota bacterium]
MALFSFRFALVPFLLSAVGAGMVSGVGFSGGFAAAQTAPQSAPPKSAPPKGAPQSASLPAPLGLWQYSRPLAPDTLRLVLAREGQGGWSATIDGKPYRVAVANGALSLTAPGDNRFTGRLSEDGRRIEGFWYQPADVLHYQDVATPVRLERDRSGGEDESRADSWSGELAIQSRPYRLFLDIFEGEDGSILAAFRNPEGNNIMFSYRFAVERDTARGWDLVRRRGDNETRYDLDVSEAGTLSLDYPRIEGMQTFTLAGEAPRPGYYPRDPKAGDIGFSVPERLDDGWEVATPEEAGFDRAALDALAREMAGYEARAARPKLVHSMLVAHKGKLIFEDYFYGYDREARHDVRSLGKVFGSVLVGALQQQGSAIDPQDRTVERVLAEAGAAPKDPRTNAVTLADLMTYTSGLDCVSNDTSLGSEERMWEQEDEDNYWRFTATLPQLHAPGARYAYCSGSANLVGASLVEYGGAPVHHLFDRLIAQPLGFGAYHWPLAPNGEGYLGGGAYMRARDVLKVGALYTGGGAWNGRQVLEPGWIETSTTAKLPITAQTTGLSPEDFNNFYFGGEQAYIWRVDTVVAGEKSYRSYEASGNGGQLLIIVPELDLAVVFMGGNYRDGGVWGRWRNALIGGHIIPAMRPATAGAP